MPCTCEAGCEHGVVPGVFGTINWRAPKPSCPCDGHTVWRIFHNRKDEIGGRA